MRNEETLPPELHIAEKKTGALYWSCFLLGCGVLLPWNAQSSAVDYLKRTYQVRQGNLVVFPSRRAFVQNYDAMRWIVVCFMPTSTVTAFLNSLLPPKQSGQGRIALGFFAASVTLLVPPVVSCHIHLCDP